MNMATIRATLRGKRTNGILMNPMSEETLLGIWSKNYKQVPKDMTPEEVAESKLLRNDDGRLILPIKYLLSCLVAAGRKVKMGPMTKVSNATSTELYSFFETEQEELVLHNGKPDEDPEWVTDIRAGRSTSGKDRVAVCIIRPHIKDWATEVEFKVDRDIVSDLSTIRQVFDMAGRVGMGDFRSSCKGPFGQFSVEKWEVLDPGQDSKAAATKGKGRAKAKPEADAELEPATT